MKIERNEIGALHFELTITLEKEDYLEEFQKKLLSIKSKSHLKGFRKGKTPKSMLMKMYGTEALSEVVTELIENTINDQVKQENYTLIGEPLFLDADNPPLIDHANLEDYVYRFELGLQPEFELKSLSSDDIFDLYEIETSEAEVDKELDQICQQLGEQKSTDSPIVDNDIIYLFIQELDGENVKEEGFNSTFSINVDALTPEYKSLLLGASVGHIFDVDICNLEKDRDEKYIKKYFLNISDNDDSIDIDDLYKAKVVDVIRAIKAEVTPEVFNDYFIDHKIDTIEDARKIIREDIKKRNSTDSKSFQRTEMLNKLVSLNEINLPTEFLKKMYSSNEELTDEKLVEIEKELKRTLLSKKLIDRYEIEVKDEEIYRYFIGLVHRYSPNLETDDIRNMINELVKSEANVAKAYQNISWDHIYTRLQDIITSVVSTISRDDFSEKIKMLN